MARALVIALGLMASGCAAAPAGGEPLRLAVALPADSRTAAKLYLVLEGVTLPGNQPLKVRVTSTNEMGREVLLGSVGVEAVSPDEPKPRRLPSLRLDATRGLKEVLQARGNAEKVGIIIRGVDGKNRPIQDLKWSIESARLETRNK